MKGITDRVFTKATAVEIYDVSNEIGLIEHFLPERDNCLEISWPQTLFLDRHREMNHLLEWNCIFRDGCEQLLAGRS